MDFNNILLIFQQLSGCDVEKMNDQMPLIKNAADRFTALIDEDKLLAGGGDIIARCEYAAACCAVYDHVCALQARERLICTADGKASMSEDLGSRIDAAQRLKISALGGLGEIFKDEEFLFETTGGA